MALALLAALCAGPSGATGVLHPADDTDCRLPLSDGADSGSRVAAAPSDTDLHCPTCHLLRSVRWGMSTSVAPGVVPECAVDLTVGSEGPVATEPLLAAPGRAPPRGSGATDHVGSVRSSHVS